MRLEEWKHELNNYMDEKEIGTSMKNKSVKKKNRWFITIPTTIIAIILLVVVTQPFAFLTASKVDYTIDKIVIPDVRYAHYHYYFDKTNEVFFGRDFATIGLNYETNEEFLMLENVSIYSIGINEKWLVWEENGYMQILNRQTGDKQTVSSQLMGLVVGLDLYNDDAIFMTKLEADKEYQYYRLNLNSLMIDSFHQNKIFGSHSKPDINEELILFQEEKDGSTNLYLYSQDELQLRNQFVLPYEIVQEMHLTSSHIYAVVDFNHILSLNIETGEQMLLDLEEDVWGFSTDGTYFAITVGPENKNTTKLYMSKEGKLQLVSVFPELRERLVLPRFVDEGKLILNGESEEFPLYQINLSR